MSLVLPSTAVGTAQAHAVVTGTEPADGAVLTAPPAEVVVQFNEPVSLTRAQVLDPAGQDVLASGAAEVGNERLRFVLPAGLTEGSYTVSYHVVSLDGHPVAGSMVFSVGQVSAGASGVREADRTRSWRRALVAAHALLYLGMFGAAGGVAYTLVVKPGGTSLETNRRIAGVSAVFGLVAAVTALGLQGGLLLGGPWAVLLDPATWATGAGSTFGRTALCAMLGLLLIWMAGWARRPSATSPLGLLGAFFVLGSLALSGHVVTAGPRGLTTPLLLIHAAVAAFWTGSLIPLHRMLARTDGEAHSHVERFSLVAIRAVPVLIFAGLILMWLQVRRTEALVTTDYGRVLLIKLGLVAALLGLAALNRFRLTPTLVRGDKGAAAHLNASILAEAGLVVAILTSTAALSTTPPPRALVPTTATDAAHTHVHEAHGQGSAHRERRLRLSGGEGVEATVVLEPRRNGAEGASIILLDAEGRPLEVMEVTLRLSNPHRNIALLERPAQRDGVGAWRVSELVLAVAGEWEIELDVLVSDFERHTLTGAFELD